MNKNKIEGIEYSVRTSDAKDQIIHKPNRKIFFFKFHLWMYRVGLEKIGEEPVLIDSSKIKQSALNIQSYLFSKGYFNNEVSYEVKKKRFRNKANVIYKVTENQAYTYDHITWVTEDSLMSRFMKEIWSKRLLKKGDVVDYQVIEAERKRISEAFKTSGFYAFNRSMVDFQLDTNDNHLVDVRVRLQDRGIKQRVYYINQVAVTIFGGNESKDTIYKKVKFKLNGYKVKPDVLHKNILISAGEKYNQEKVANTYSRLFGLEMFNFIDVSFSQIDSSNALLCNISLKPSEKHDLIWEPQLVTTEQRIGTQNLSRNFGLANAISLKNKNVFRNGEELNLTIRTGWEAQIGGGEENINTFSQEINTQLKVPQLIFIKEYGRRINAERANTRLNLSYIYEKNRYYTRKVLPFTMLWEGRKNHKNWYVSPVTISYNQSSVEPEFLSGLPEATQAYFNRIFSNNLITSVNTVLTYSSLSNKVDQKNIWYVRTTLLEMAGVGLPQITDNGQAFGVNHASFLRSDADVRYTYKLSDNHQVVFRTNVGLGMPLYNSFLPYERRYFVGGANNMRGFRPRTVGPGSYSNSGVQIDRSGELMIQGNMEYRSKLIQGKVDLEGALFMDFGNVWNVVDDANYEGGLFELDRFSDEFAINTGLGLRFDFGIFLIRVDWGVPVKDPNEAVEDRIVIGNAIYKSWLRDNGIWNIAIGHPF